MKSENVQVDWHDKIDALRRELTPKIDGKISDKTFWTIIGFFVLIIMAISGFLMSLNQRATCVETKLEMLRPTMTQQLPPTIPTKE